MPLQSVIRFIVLLILVCVAAFAAVSCSSEDEGTHFDNAIVLREDVWKDGRISSEDGAQWFRFTATAGTQYIHFEFGTLSWLSVQMYDSSGNTSGGMATLSGSSGSISRSVSGQQYYIRVWPYMPGYTGTYRISFSASALPPAVSLPQKNVTALTGDVWTGGSVRAGDAEWFRFTATADTQYIHVDFDTLTALSLRVYDKDGKTAGGGVSLSGSSRSFSRALTIGQQYYVRVWPYTSAYSGTYRITFNASAALPEITLPQSGVLSLAENTWTGGTLSAGGAPGVQWFRFTATASTQYFHADFGTLSWMYLQVYDANGSSIGNSAYLYGGNMYTSCSLTIGEEYYIRVWPYSSSYSGTYKITYSSSSDAPAILPPPAGVRALTADSWENGSVVAGGTEWFCFTADAALQTIHVDFDTLSSLYIRVYDESGNAVGSVSNLSGSARSLSRSVTAGSQYYVRVWPYSSSYGGAYKIAYGTSVVPPGASVTDLAANTWADGNIPVWNGQQWFTFTATASTQYIHVQFGTLLDFYAQVYDANGAAVGGSYNFYSSYYSTSRTLTVGQTYYIRIWPFSSSYSGTYSILFNASNSTGAGSSSAGAGSSSAALSSSSAALSSSSAALSSSSAALSSSSAALSSSSAALSSSSVGVSSSSLGVGSSSAALSSSSAGVGSSSAGVSSSSAGVSSSSAALSSSSAGVSSSSAGAGSSSAGVSSSSAGAGSSSAGVSSSSAALSSFASSALAPIAAWNGADFETTGANASGTASGITRGIDAAEYHGGSKSYKISGTASASATATILTTTGMSSSGGRMYLTFWIKGGPSVAEGQTGAPRVRMFLGASTNVSFSSDNPGISFEQWTTNEFTAITSDGPAGSIINGFTGKTLQSWVKIKMTLPAGFDTTGSRVRFHIPNNGAINIYVDDFMFTDEWDAEGTSMPVS